MASDSNPRPFSNSGFAPAMSAGKGGPGGDSRETDDSRSPREIIVRAVVRGLYEGRYEPGQRLVEAELTAAHGVSRGSVREALNRLAASGVVELTLQRGAQVRILTIDEAVDILVVVHGLIGIAARLAATRITQPGAAERMMATVDAISAFDPESSTPEYAIARDNFYAALTGLAGNKELRRVLPTVQIHLVRVQFRAVLRSTNSRRHNDYRRIANAVLAGSPAAAEAAVHKHLDRSIAALAAFRDVDRDRHPS